MHDILIAYVFSWNTKKRESVARTIIKQSTSITEICSEANGRLFVLKTLLSIFLSTKSLTAQPNDLVKMTPITNIPKILMSGIPLLDSHNAQRVGHRSKKIPMGLLSLSRFMNGRILII